MVGGRRTHDAEMPLARQIGGLDLFPSDEPQLSFQLAEIHEVRKVPGLTITERFERFHAANPSVYRAMVAIALDLRSRGFRRCGISLITERLRWLYALQTRGESYSINNDYRAFYARMIMENEPDLTGFFELRRQRAVERDQAA